MYQYIWDEETGGPLLITEQSKFSKEPRPVYYKELDILGFDRYWNYPKDDSAPLMWAEANNYIYRGRTVAKTKGGSLYTAPEIIILEDPELDGQSLRFVDIDKMVMKNTLIMESLIQETIQNVYNTYWEFKDKVDVFHVSFSGGKDSFVTLDVVQRSIPHNDFIVIFGDTGMEFPDTYIAVDYAKQECENNGIQFYIAKSHKDPLDNWKTFGPPSTTLRWCCGVHKTTPQLLCLRDIVEKNNLIEMAFVGIRADESIRRSRYEYISYGKKHKGQYSYNPILEWSSIEVYLYIYMNNLYLNEAYKKGNSRAGCLVCPMAADKNEYMRYQCYPKEVEKYIDVIRDTNAREFPSKEDDERFINVGGWKVRNNGRDIKSIPIKYFETSATEIKIIDPAQDWCIWMKTLGEFTYDGATCHLTFKNNVYSFMVEAVDNGYKVTFSEELVKSAATVVKYIKQVFRKAVYCIGCKECQADCPHGYIGFEDGNIRIDDNCKHCLNCHKTPGGCLLFKSVEQPKGTGKMNNKAIDCYADHAPKIEWIQSFFELKERFFEEHTLGSVMINMFKRFLKDAELTSNGKVTELTWKLDEIGIDTPAFWGILLVNLAHSAEVGWYINNMPFEEPINKNYMIELLQNAGTKERGAKSVSGAYRRIVSLPFGDLLGLGSVHTEGRSFSITRHSWIEPDARVILYSFYKFAEKCGGYYQFTLETLLDDSIEREGISPTRIFGLDYNVMVPLLNGLSVNYPDFISASFSLGLNTITLRSDKTSQDVLNLF